MSYDNPDNSYAVDSSSSGTSQQGRQAGETGPSQGVMRSPLASLKVWRARWGGASSARRPASSAAAADGRDYGHAQAAADIPEAFDGSSGSSGDGGVDGSRQQQLGMGTMQQQGRSSPSSGRSTPGLLAALRTGVWRSGVQGLGRRRRGAQGKRGSEALDRSTHVSRRRRSSLMYGVMVIDMGVHQLSGLGQKVNLTQVGVREHERESVILDRNPLMARQ